MEHNISLKITAEGTTNVVRFTPEKRDNKIYVGFYLREEKVGEMELTLDDFNNFCLDLFSLQKEIGK